MFRIIGFFIAVLLIGTGAASATVQINPEQSIFENISVIDPDKVKEIITDSLMDELQADKLKVDLRDYSKAIQLKTKKDSFDVDIVDHSFNKRSRRFDYKIAFSNGDFKQVLDVHGNYEKIVSIPSLAKAAKSDTVINDSDIEYIEIAEHKLHSDTITNAEDLVGKSLRHSEPALRPMRLRDIQRQNVVERSDSINIVYVTPTITLTATGIALDSGAKGDLIRIRNVSSNKVVQAKIKDSSTALVEQGTL